ncbi:uncharacterized protein [Embiotoca jacksoni]|uniref:uncharacterized protein n=1 Tax=Embiotoca jacksoni TaxID=100190 RepID=UPI003704A6C8
MAGSSIRKAVAGALEDLTEKDFQKFCFHLLDHRDEPRVKRNRVEGKNFMEITDVLVNHFTEERAVLVTVDLLNQIGCCGVAKTLAAATTEEVVRRRRPKLPPEERQRRLREGCCFYCGQPGHKVSTCPEKGSPGSMRVPVSQTLSSYLLLQMMTNLQLIGPFEQTKDHEVVIDSGADLNFMDWQMAERLNLKVIPLPQMLEANARDRPVSFNITHRSEPVKLVMAQGHTETLSFHLVDCPRRPLVLGRPWLIKHSPHFCWSTGHIMGWGKSCSGACFLPDSSASVAPPTSSPSPKPSPHKFADTSKVPAHYTNRKEVFSRAQDTCPHCCIGYDSRLPITIKNRFLFHSPVRFLRDAKVFTKLSLRNAEEGSEGKIAYNTPSGDFGRTNASAVFPALVKDVLRDVLNIFVLVDLGDVLIFSPDRDSHMQHVSRVLQHLENRLYVEAKKCEYHVSSVSFLGFVVSNGSIRIDPDNVRFISKRPTPKSRKQLKDFLKLTDFYHHFIHNYSFIAAPLHDLTSASVKFCWSSPANAAFHRLQKSFTSAPTLIIPDTRRQFIVKVNASDSDIRAVLLQGSLQDNELHYCAFLSRRLSPSERNYDVCDKELLSVRFALKEWRRWLEAVQHPFIVWMDYRNLEKIRSAKRFSFRRAKWARFFNQFDFTLSHRPRSKNMKTGYLSQSFGPNSNPNTPSNMTTSCLGGADTLNIENKVKQAHRGVQGPDGRPAKRLFIPASLRLPVISWAHSNQLSCHPGVYRTLLFAKQRFWWPAMAKDVKTYVLACRTCAQCETSCPPLAARNDCFDRNKKIKSPKAVSRVKTDVVAVGSQFPTDGASLVSGDDLAGGKVSRDPEVTVNKTYDHDLQRFVMPGLKPDVRHEVGKQNRTIPPHPVNPILKAAEPFELVAVDRVGQFPQTKADISTVATVLMFLHLFGLSNVTQTDQGFNFVSQIFAQVMKQLDVTDGSKSSKYWDEGAHLWKNFMEITDALVNHFTEERAVLVMVDLLNQIGCSGVAKTLGEETAGRSSAAAEQHGKKDQHFVDKHRNDLIQRVSNVGPILDELLTKVIQQERYDAIRAVKPSQEQMREIYGVLLKAGTDAKDIFYNSLQKHEKCLLQDLQK